MIKSIRLVNWEAHRNSYIEFSEKTNAIIGSSDCGKSSLMKAMNWVLTNRPLGDSFRSTWGGDTIVEVCTTDGHIVKRVQTNSANKYFVDGLELKAFGTSVPDEVLKCLNMTETNIAKQFSSFCLLSETAGEVARKLNKAANLDKIDHCLTSVAAEIKETRQNLKTTEAQVGDLYAKLQLFEYLGQRKIDLDAVEKRILSHTHNNNQADLVHSLIERAKEVEADISKCFVDLGWEDLVKNIQTALDIKNRNTELYAKIQQTKTLAERLETRLVAFAPIRNDMDPLLVQIEQIIQAGKANKQKQKQLTEYINRYRHLCSEVQKQTTGTISMEKEFNELMPDTCPLCGSVKNE